MKTYWWDGGIAPLILKTLHYMEVSDHAPDTMWLRIYKVVPVL